MTNSEHSVPTPHPHPTAHPGSLRKDAQRILTTPGVRISMVLATVLFLTFWIGSIYLVENTWYSINWNTLYEKSEMLYHLADALVYAVDAVIVVFVGLPLLYGWLRFMFLAATGALPPYSVLFCAFGNRRIYFRSIALCILAAVLIAWPYALAVLMALLAYLLNAYGGIIGVTLMVLLSILSGATVILGSLCNTGSTLLLWLEINHPDDSIKQLLVRTFDAVNGKRAELWLHNMTLIPTYLLGIVTLGVMLIYHALPLTFVAQQRSYAALTGERLPSATIVFPD